MIELTSTTLPQLDTISAASVTLRAKVTGGDGHAVRFVRNGEALSEVDVVGDEFVHEARATAPASGEDFWRVEVLQQGRRRTITSHLFLVTGPAEPSADEPGGGCGCATGSRTPAPGILALSLVVAVIVVRRRERVRLVPTCTLHA
jgi:MYXO-CTERM domain-containing protein